MKISLRWLFEHIDAPWQSCDVSFLVKRFVESVAEIEEVYELSLDQTSFALGQVTAVLDDHILLNIPEWKSDYKMTVRAEAQVGDRYLVFRKAPDKSVCWATLSHCGGSKEGLMPALFGDLGSDALAGAWKKKIAWTDTLLVVDNKSITHRPDMWGHRGFAREVAALILAPLRPIDDFCTFRTKIQATSSFVPDEGGIESALLSPACSRFATLSLPEVTVRPSLPSVAFMLARVDARPIDALVDLTNYVMLDIGQPLHAYDVATLDGNMLAVRNARDGESVELLDGQKITLSREDLVIADDSNILGLAGIMGGKASGITYQTRKVILESATFDAGTIRRTASRYKIRTEASARFEKTLDPAMSVTALERCVRLCAEWQLPVKIADELVSLGDEFEPGLIIVSHDFIEDHLGLELPSIKIVTILEKLDFKVQLRVVDGETDYQITVPTFRATKDIKLPEDIVEEIGRSLGYTSIIPLQPLMPAQVKDLTALTRVRLLKRLMSSALSMRELYSYGLCDEAWLQEIGWQPEHTVDIKNPLSEQWRRTVTTLIPALLKAVHDNQVEHDQLRFFEWARIWRNGEPIIEKKSLAAIFYDKRAKLSFYDVKAELLKVFDALSLPVTFVRIDEPDYLWYMPHQSAHITVNGTSIGTVGIVHPSFMKHLGNGIAALVECDGDFLLSYKASVKRFVPLAKFPSSARDISLLVPLSLEAACIQKEIAHVDRRITEVVLVDFFEKAEWLEKRSLTFRYIMQDAEKTLTKEETDTIEQKVLTCLKALGAEVR